MSRPFSTPPQTGNHPIGAGRHRLRPLAPVLVISAALGGCSVLPGTGEGIVGSRPTESHVDGAALKALAEEARAARSKAALGDTSGGSEPATAEAERAEPGKLAAAALPQERRGLQAKPLQGGSAVARSGATLPSTTLPSTAIPSTAFPRGKIASAAPAGTTPAGTTPAERHAAALALLARARTSHPATRAGDLDDLAGRPKTYRLDGPGPAPGTAPSAGNSPALIGVDGRPVASYPREGSGQFAPPAQLADARGFTPPDPAPGATRQTDPQALMEAIERLRAKRVTRPAEIQTSALPGTSGRSDAASVTGSVPAAAGPVLDPASPLTFVEFAPGATTLPPAQQALIAAMLKPFAAGKENRVVATIGLGGSGDAYSKLLQANQRAQTIASLVPPRFTIIRRFDPALPNQSVRLFVVKSER